ncbi:FkbM family methyltransferase [candidate division KSB1 bacterium]|nr:FkbM family methyltransferase [candidate division KSB1 bacterium]
MKPYPLFRLGNQLYKHAFWLYLPLYTLYKRINERAERRLIKQIIQPGQCVIDIGANIGIYTRLFAELVGPTGVIHAFEPERTNFQRLQRLTKSFANVITHQTAISDHTGQITLYYSDDLNVDHRTYGTPGIRRAEIVNCMTLDDYLYGRPIDFIKMDIQGYEYAALQGMARTLRENANVRLIMELSPYDLQLAGSSQESVVQFLHARQFQIFLIRNSQVVPFPIGGLPGGKTHYYNLFVMPKGG